LNTSRTNGKHSGATARARPRITGRLRHGQPADVARQANSDDLPQGNTHDENAAKVWKVIAKHREARLALQAADDAERQLDEAKGEYEKP
jgi:hypothetical protein